MWKSGKAIRIHNKLSGSRVEVQPSRVWEVENYRDSIENPVECFWLCNTHTSRRIRVMCLPHGMGWRDKIEYTSNELPMFTCSRIICQMEMNRCDKLKTRVQTTWKLFVGVAWDKAWFWFESKNRKHVSACVESDLYSYCCGWCPKHNNIWSTHRTHRTRSNEMWNLKMGNFSL